MREKDVTIDLSYLQDLASDNKDFMVEMIDVFLLQTPNYLAVLEEGVVSKNFKTIADASHKIKPTLTFMGVASAKETITEMESWARKEENYEGILNDFNSLKEVFKTIYVKLEEKKSEFLAND
ncbi:histidine phosphotransferase [Pedobacter psychrophilus]|uniref:Histidine phosphotransferase n=1 Tax=Pedobacter psychrophilus TaxID=1826909 RepID=A0A179DMQ1_9SPHI|nr:Hpt domain-containing protein [Pedobacter psychrophilus]OAQ42158.1 histidine phosphotransferase [Pedobacter psychrophilus]